jgi:hypothetical protein
MDPRTPQPVRFKRCTYTATLKSLNSTLPIVRAPRRENVRVRAAGVLPHQDLLALALEVTV